mmetsp:Transcript_20326/g.61910  ORF Transcript_20326/g.61910 Transcript_20326/m.61910 type:complete len:80 (+) Transcript_20326:1010-1249(+)
MHCKVDYAQLARNVLLECKAIVASIEDTCLNGALHHTWFASFRFAREETRRSRPLLSRGEFVHLAVWVWNVRTWAPLCV